tara:strand:- start:4583 stop:6262 length:1680 start_codon:yes stop_codon:yes gene_type:complete
VQAFLVDQDLDYPSLIGAKIIYTNYINYICSESSNKFYLFNNKNKFFEEEDFSETFFQEWFRDEKKKDNFSNEVSIVQILNRLTFFSLLNDIKNFNALKYWTNKFSKIKIITSSESIKRVSYYFDNIEVVKDYTLKTNNSNYIPSAPERKNYFFFKMGLKNQIVSLFERFLKFRFKKNKYLAFIDKRVNSNFLKIKNTLFLNDKKFLKGFYLHNHNHHLKFNKNISNYSNYKTSLYLFKKYFNENESNFLNRVFFNLVNQEFYRNKDLIIKAYNCIDKTLKFYKPKGLILNSANDWITSIFLQLSTKYKIKKFLLLDGYNFFNSNLNIPKNILNNEYYDYYFAYGKAFSKNLLKYGINSKKIIQIEIPKFNINTFKKKIIFDCCIVSYNPYIFSLNTTWDSKIITELEILHVLNKLQLKKICIKVKNSHDSLKKNSIVSVDKIYELYAKVYNEKLNLSISLQEGELKNSILKSKILIGGISTSVLESNLLNTPYYVYEPINNGIKDSFLDSLFLIEKKFIIRTNKDLFLKIKQNNYCKLNLNHENKGSRSSDLDLNLYI